MTLPVAEVTAQERPLCPVCLHDDRQVPLVPFGRFWWHADGPRQRSSLCHITSFVERPRPPATALPVKE